MASGTRASLLEMAKLVVVVLLVPVSQNRLRSWRYTDTVVEDILSRHFVTPPDYFRQQRFAAMCRVTRVLQSQYSHSIEKELQDTEDAL